MINLFLFVICSSVLHAVMWNFCRSRQPKLSINFDSFTGCISHLSPTVIDVSIYMSYEKAGNHLNFHFWPSHSGTKNENNLISVRKILLS